MCILLSVQEALVVAHEHLRLECADGLKCNTDNDDDGRAAQGDAGELLRLRARADDQRRDRDDAQVDRAEERDLVEHLLDEFARRLACTEARDEPTVLLQVVGDLDRVELDRGVEVAEEDDEQEVDDDIRPGGRIKDVLHDPTVLPLRNEGADGGRQRRDRLGEDDRQDAAHVHLHRQVRALAAVHLAADHALGILHRQTALGVVDEHDEHDEQQGAEVHQHQDPPGEVAIGDVVDLADDGVREAGDDAHEQDDRDTVADAELGDLLTKPHDEGGAGRKGQDNDDGCPDIAGKVRVDEAVVAHHHIIRKALQQADGDRAVAGDAGDLLLAFLAAFLLQTLQSGDRNAQELNDDGSVDVRLDGQREDRRLRERAAGHDVEQAQDRVLQATSLEVVGQCFGVDERYGYGIAETVKQDNQKRKENFLAQFLNAPCVTKCLEHLTPPQPFLLLPRSSLSRIRRTQKPSQSASW